MKHILLTYTCLIPCSRPADRNITLSRSAELRGLPLSPLSDKCIGITLVFSWLETRNLYKISAISSLDYGNVASQGKSVSAYLQYNVNRHENPYLHRCAGNFLCISGTAHATSDGSYLLFSGIQTPTEHKHSRVRAQGLNTCIHLNRYIHSQTP